jgi:hypothetical protein
LWLYGDAGAGKSAIAQTLAEIFASEKQLLGSFFFSRNDPQRATHDSLVATIAYQAATTIPQLAEPIISAVDRDPRIFDKTLQTQLTTLIIDPLNAIKACSPPSGDSIPHFLIIDGLDECTNRQIHRHLLEVLSEAVRSHHLKVLIASRPETEILSAFNALTEVSTRLALDATEFKSDDDISFLLKSTFQKIKVTHPHKSFIPESWPSDDILDALVQKSSGKFIYPSTVTKYISSERHKPVERLKIVLGLKPPSSDNDLPFAELDALYRHIFFTIPKDNLDQVLFTLGVLVSCPPVSQDSGFSWNTTWLISSFLFLEPGDLEFLLGDLSSILKCSDQVDDETDYETKTIQISHASVADFLLDPQRSKEFHISKPQLYTQMARTCLQHLNVGIPDHAHQWNSESFCQQNEMMFFSFEILPEVLERASLTMELREDISQLSLMSTLQSYRLRKPKVWFDSHDLIRFALKFVYQLENLVSSYHC